MAAGLGDLFATHMTSYPSNALRTRIKICGLTREQDLLAAVEAGADAVGFVLYDKSPRYVAPTGLAVLAALLPPFVTPVLLFVNPSHQQVQEALQVMPTALLQFHGDESPQACQALAGSRPYIRAARMGKGFDLLNFVAQFASAQAVLLDAHVDGYGGGGKVFDWSLVPVGVRHPVVLSGGLKPENVIDGIVQVRPWAVDVSSGVEQAKGVKDATLMRRFCEAVREADARIASTQA